jgi:hypothetical protein
MVQRTVGGVIGSNRYNTFLCVERVEAPIRLGTVRNKTNFSTGQRQCTGPTQDGARQGQPSCG